MVEAEQDYLEYDEDLKTVQKTEENQIKGG